jgi:hypothetical protein
MQLIIVSPAIMEPSKKNPISIVFSSEDSDIIYARPKIASKSSKILESEIQLFSNEIL